MNKRTTYSILGAGLAATAGFLLWQKSRKAYLPVADYVDLDKYMGLWYEIARLPAPYEKGCHLSKAFYSKNTDGTVKVVNSCRKGSIEGKETTTEGKAFVVDKQTNAKLKVQFLWPFTGDYYIIEVDKDYTYALVGEPTRKNLWILSRSQHLEKEIVDRLISYSKSLGFDTNKLIFTEQKVLEPVGNPSE